MGGGTRAALAGALGRLRAHPFASWGSKLPGGSGCKGGGGGGEPATEMETPPTMPCLWDSNELPDGERTHLRTFHGAWWAPPRAGDGGWSAGPVSTAADPPPTVLALAIVHALGIDAAGGSNSGSTCPAELYVALRTPDGCLLAVGEDRSLSTVKVAPGSALHAGSNSGAGSRAVPAAATFLARRIGDAQVQLQSVANGHWVRALDDGSIRADAEAPSGWEAFLVRHVEAVPRIAGANLGGWLVAEQWMDPPELFAGAHPGLGDGTVLHMRSAANNKWLCAEGGGGGPLLANRDDPQGWETFYIQTAAATDACSSSLHIRASSGQFWTTAADGKLLASARDAGEHETFAVRLQEPEDKSGGGGAAMLKASSGAWVRVAEDGSLAADVWEEAPDWGSACELCLDKVSDMGGEWQLSKGLGAAEAARRLAAHRASFVTEGDFAWMAANGVNAARIPVGYWIAADPPPEPFVAGSMVYLDKAFEWAATHGVRVVVCLHAAPGSQNGWEHSASRDGIPEWGRSGKDHVARSLDVVEWLAARYGQHPMLLGLELLNEPRSDGAPLETLKQYYRDGYAAVRRYSKRVYVHISPRVWAPDSDWADFMTGHDYMNVIFDVHYYNVHDAATFGGKSAQWNIDYVKGARLDYIRSLERGTRLVCIGEWSNALLGECQPDDGVYTAFGEAQVGAYTQASAGWFFWSLRHGQGWQPWSLKDCIEAQWIRPQWWGFDGGAAPGQCRAPGM
eukprot:SM000172S03072  [mRNA]  locus=s172:152092:155525:- [translate_table: standard]